MVPRRYGNLDSADRVPSVIPLVDAFGECDESLNGGSDIFSLPWIPACDVGLLVISLCTIQQMG
jgi:hypothetical protein